MRPFLAFFPAVFKSLQARRLKPEGRLAQRTRSEVTLVQAKGRVRSRPSFFLRLKSEAHFASARLSGLAGHDLISVS